MSALALRICGLFCLFRAYTYCIYPETMLPMMGYPPAATAGGWGKKPDEVPVAEDIMTVTLVLQFYGLVQAALGGLCLSIARVGDPYTMVSACSGFGLLWASLTIYTIAKMDEVSEHIDVALIKKILIPVGLLAVYMLYAGGWGWKTWSVHEPIGKSGTVMILLSFFGVAQGMLPIVKYDEWVTTFGMSITHPSTATLVGFLTPMWGGCIIGGSIIRLLIVQASHTASIYQANRATAVYFAMMIAMLSVVKSLGKFSEEAVLYQTGVATAYFCLAYFYGTVGDDMAALKAKTA